MKKVKIMLTAITVFAVVGGALAFKAKSAGFHLYKCNTTQNKCLIEDADNTYKIDNTKTPFASATITNVDPGTAACSAKCPNTVTGTFEPLP